MYYHRLLYVLIYVRTSYCRQFRTPYSMYGRVSRIELYLRYSTVLVSALARPTYSTYSTG